MDTAAVLTLAASGIISAQPGHFIGAALAAGADAATMILYDNASAATGTVICKLSAELTGGANFAPGTQIYVKNGIYAALTGTAPLGTVVFK